MSVARRMADSHQMDRHIRVVALLQTVDCYNYWVTNVYYFTQVATEYSCSISTCRNGQHLEPRYSSNGCVQT